MRRRIRTWQISCDHCHHSVVASHAGMGRPSVPDGWGKREEHDCGMTGFTKVLELCPECLQKWDEAHDQ